MDPSTAILISSLFASLFGGLFGGGDQELQSFADTHDLSPAERLSEAINASREGSKVAKSFANQPVKLRSSYVQAPPVFTGGGLPMPVGVLGRDPALDDPGLLELPGFDFSMSRGDQPGDETSEDETDSRDETSWPTSFSLRRKSKTGSDAEQAALALQFLL